MDASGRSSSSRGRALAALAAAGLAAGGCVDERAPIRGTTSLAVELDSPADPGNEVDRLPDDVRAATVSVTALDAQGELDESFTRQVDLYVHYLGGLTPELGTEPLLRFPIEEGVSGSIDVELPGVYGPTFLWVEDGRGGGATFATGTSDVLWFRDPYLADVSRPLDEGALDALERSPLEAKQVRVSGSRYGADGRLVVTGVYSQGYTLSDVSCQAGGAPPCTTGDYDAVFVFSFGRPTGLGTGAIEIGDVVESVTGGISEFNGLTEVNFPETVVAEEERDADRLPEPLVIQPAWLASRIEMERAEAGVVAIENATVCELDDDYDTYSQWKLDLGNGCGDPVNVITAGQVDFDPAEHVGQVLPRVVGTLRPVNIGSFDVWIIYPRSNEDLTLP
jgi:hypothetical protein